MSTLGKPQRIFFSGPATEALPPSSLVATFFCHNLFFMLQNKFFFLSGPVFTQPPLSGRATKNNFFCDFPYQGGQYSRFMDIAF